MKTQDKNTQISVYCIQHYCKEFRYNKTIIACTCGEHHNCSPEGGAPPPPPPALTKFSKYHSYIVSSVLYMLLVEEIGGPGEKTSTSST